MTQQAKLFINTDVNVIFTIGEGFSIGDILSMEITLTKAGATSGTTFSGDNVTVGDSNVVLSIPNTDGISEVGVYYVKAVFTDTEGKKWGLTPIPTDDNPTPEYLTFYA